MFGYVSGQLLTSLEVDNRFVLITVIPQGINGFGLSMLVVSEALERQLKIGQYHKNYGDDTMLSQSQGSTVNFYIYNYVTQHDSYSLGISELRRYRLFLSLLRYSGVGPKVAASIVEFFEDFETLLQILVHKDIEKLAQVPGIGRKKAGKILVNLIDAAETQQFIGKISQSQKADIIQKRFSALIGALQALGLSKTDAVRMVRENLREINAFLNQHANNESEAEQNIANYTGELLKLVLKARGRS